VSTSSERSRLGPAPGVVEPRDHRALDAVRAFDPDEAVTGPDRRPRERCELRCPAIQGRRRRPRSARRRRFGDADDMGAPVDQRRRRGEEQRACAGEQRAAPRQDALRLTSAVTPPAVTTPGSVQPGIAAGRS
jgi:hypothetical protein